MPIEPRHTAAFHGVGRAVAGFSSNPTRRLSSSTSITPNRRDSASGTSMAAMVSAAPRAMCTSSILL